MIWASQKAKLKKGGQPYGFKIADFPLLKIRSGVYFPFTNTIYMKVEFYPLFPFLPARTGKFSTQKGAPSRPYTDGISIRKCARQDEGKVNAFQLDQQRIVQGENMLRELIETIVRALVDNPEQVKVSEIEGGMTSIIQLWVAKPDLGKVIGKQGRNVHAMRTILSAASTKIHKRGILEIIG